MRSEDVCNVHQQMIPFGVARSWGWLTVVTKYTPDMKGEMLSIGSDAGNELKCNNMKEIIKKEVKTTRLRDLKQGESFIKEMHLVEQETVLYVLGIPVFRKKESFGC